MTKRRREAEPIDATAETAELNTVFVDTSLDTHLAMLICSCDTASDFKKKFALEHMQCFPEMGQIHVHSVKVKRRSTFYHLPEIMLVWSAFHGVKKNWFVSVDVSSIQTCRSIKSSSEHGTSSGVKIGLTDINDDCRGFTSDANRNDILSLSLHDGAAEKNAVSEMIAGPKVDKPVEKTTDFYKSIYSEENIMGTEFRAKKKHKVSHTKLACQNPSLGGGGAMFHSEGKVGKPTISDSIVKVSGGRNDQYDVEGKSPPIMAGKNIDFLNINGSDRGKENNKFDIMLDNQHSGVVSVMLPDYSARHMDVSGGGEDDNTVVKKANVLDSKLDVELDQNVPTVQSGGVCTNMANLSDSVVDASGGVGDINTDRKKRKKKKVEKPAEKVQDTKDDEHIGNVEIKKPRAETIKFEEREKEKGLSLEHDHEVILPSDSKARDNVDPDIALKEASLVRDADAVMDTEISSGTKKRKKRKREKVPLGTSIEHSGITEIHDGIRGSLGFFSPSSDHIPKESGKDVNEGKDVQMKLLDGPNHDPQVKAWDVNRRETDLDIKTQAEENVVDVNVTNKNIAVNAKSSAGDSNADFPTAETENTIMGSNRADKDNGNSENGDIKAKTKRKKKKLIATDVQENSMVKDQQVGIELLATKEPLVGFVNSEQVGQLDSSQILSRKSEDNKIDKVHELAVKTDDLAENSAKDGEGINFKQYFVPDRLKNKVDSGVKAKKGTKLQRSSKKAKDNDSPSVNMSAELQNSIKSIEDKKTENVSNRKQSGKTKCDSTQNPDWGEISNHSLKRYSEAPKIDLNDSSPSELTRQKPDGIAAAPTFQNKNPSLNKSSAQKKILLGKSVDIFQDNSGESSGDENKIIHSDDSTVSPSDSSSMSGDSEGEAELSQNSTSKGSNDAKSKSESKLDRAASKDMTIEMILRSSKRFKKAREVASSQNDFAPDSQTK